MSRSLSVSVQWCEEQKLSHHGWADWIHQQQTARPSAERDPVPAAEAGANTDAHGEVWAQPRNDSERSVSGEL